MLTGVRSVRALRWLGCRSQSSKHSNNASESPLRRLVKEAAVGGEAVADDPELQWATGPYAAGVDGTRRADPRTAGEGTVLLFPGQGAHYVGMGRRAADIPAAKDVYDEASEVLGNVANKVVGSPASLQITEPVQLTKTSRGSLQCKTSLQKSIQWNVFKVCTEGPAEDLEARLQPALLATSLAALAIAAEERPASVESAVAAAGFSLGEWAALVWAGALSFPAALRGVEARGRAMSAAAAARPGGMLTLWLAPAAQLSTMLEQARAAGPRDAVCSLANYLYPGCRVIAGDEKCLRWVEQNGCKFGVKRAARVAVAGAWHCAVVGGAAEAVRAALQLEALRRPRARVLSAVDCREYRSARDVLAKLAAHVAAPVKWEQTLQVLYARSQDAAQPFTLLLGPGSAHRHTLKRVNAKAWDTSALVDI